jgi:hypothetical protein
MKKTLSKEELRDAICCFVDAGNPENSVYTQLQDHVNGKGCNDMPNLIGIKISKKEVQTEIDEMVVEGILRRRESNSYVKSFCGNDTKWLTIIKWPGS